ncbi:MAG: DUF4124 domain-containing protein [Burkholderiales bacterium]|nr:DUF4124 domain-containing protein [Burkholderiales bacterium]
MIIALADVHAVNKCIDAQGKTTYTDEPCPTSPRANKPAKSSATNIESGAGTDVLGAAYMKHFQSLRADGWKTFLDTMSSRQRIKVEPVGEKALALTKALVPRSIAVVDEVISPSGNTGTLRVKGMAPAMGSSGEKMNYGTIELVKEGGMWKVDKSSWSDEEWKNAGEIGQQAHKLRDAACKNASGKPESPADDFTLRTYPGETQIAKFSLSSNAGKEIKVPATAARNIMFRAAANSALRCKYSSDYPTGMSADGGKRWLYSYSAGQRVEPVNGTISLSFRNNAQEMINFVVVATD